MLARLPDVLPAGFGAFSVAERSALVLDAELYPLCDAHVLADAIDTPALRARAALAGRDSRLVAELDTAAWIWGARLAPPRTLELAWPVLTDSPTAARASGGVREVRYQERDLARIGGLSLTTRARTALDLARFREEGNYEAETLRLLIPESQVTAALALLRNRPRLPHARRARLRLASLYASTG